MKNHHPPHLTALPAALSLQPQNREPRPFEFPCLSVSMTTAETQLSAQPPNPPPQLQNFTRLSLLVDFQVSVTSAQPQSLQISTIKPQTRHMQTIKAWAYWPKLSVCQWLGPRLSEHPQIDLGTDSVSIVKWIPVQLAFISILNRSLLIVTILMSLSPIYPDMMGPPVYRTFSIS